MADPTRAAESVAARFTRPMNASTSRWGVLTDPPLVAVATGVLVIVFLGAVQLDAPPGTASLLRVLAGAPLAVAILTSLGLLGARRRVVAWLSTLPFPLENMNAVLNGLGEGLEITFTGEGPASAPLNEQLDRVHTDVFVTKNEPEAPHLVEVRIGVVDSKRNPAASAYQRFARVQEVVAKVLVPLSERYPIAGVRIK
jgi:hypothetical protein